jgi:hypothetical protein
MGRACGTYGGENRVHRALAGKPERKRPLVRPWHRLEDNIKMDLQEIGWEGQGLDGFGSRIGIGSCEHNNETLASIKCGE